MQARAGQRSFFSWGRLFSPTRWPGEPGPATLRRAQEATALYDLATAVITRVDQTEMLRSVIRKVSEALDLAACTLFLSNETGEEEARLVESVKVEYPGEKIYFPNRPHPDPDMAEAVFRQNRLAFYNEPVVINPTEQKAGLTPGEPEYLGKKIEAREMKMVMLVVLILSLSILGFSALAAINDIAQHSLPNPGPHGLTEMLYLFTSSTGNNGSAFAGITGNTDFYNITGTFAMLIGRFLMIVPIMALAGALVKKRIVPASVGTFRTCGLLFSGLLVSVVLIVGALTYFPAYSLGPIVEQFIMNAGKLFQVS